MCPAELDWAPSLCRRSGRLVEPLAPDSMAVVVISVVAESLPRSPRAQWWSPLLLNLLHYPLTRHALTKESLRHMAEPPFFRFRCLPEYHPQQKHCWPWRQVGRWRLRLRSTLQVNAMGQW